MDVGAYKRSDENKASMRFIIDDSRSCHFSLGNDKVRHHCTNISVALNGWVYYLFLDVFAGKLLVQHPYGAEQHRRKRRE